MVKFCHSAETRKKIGLAGIGRKHSSETKSRMRLARKRFFDKGGVAPMEGKHFSEQRKINASSLAKKMGFGGWNKGKHHSEEHKEKLSNILKKNWECGKFNGRTGQEVSNETRKKLSAANSLEKNGSWMGGKSFEEYGVEFNLQLKRLIKNRDSSTCQLCGSCNGTIDIHHIDYNKRNNDDNNLISLCKLCHMKTNFDREYWEELFKQMLFIPVH